MKNNLKHAIIIFGNKNILMRTNKKLKTFISVGIMNSTNGKRTVGRRIEDSLISEQNKRFHQLCEVGKTITAEINIKVLFPLVMNQANIIFLEDKYLHPQLIFNY